MLLVVVCQPGARAHTVALWPRMSRRVTFDPKPLKSGTGWYVVATYPGSQQEHIPGFKTEAEAVEWLASSRCQAWLKARGYAK